jgi:hypothetical protein
LELHAAIHRQRKLSMKHWEIIADNLSKAGFSWGCIATLDCEGERSLLLTHIATTVNASSCTRITGSLVS